MAEKKRKKTSLGWFFWLAFILLVALLFFINKENIKTVFQKTKANEIFQTKEEPTAEEQQQVDISVISDEIEKINSEESNDENVQSSKQKKKRSKDVKTSKKSDKNKENKKDKKKETKKKDVSKKTKVNKENTKEKRAKEQSNQKKSKETKKENNKKTSNSNSKDTKTTVKQVSSKKEMTAKLFFIKVGADGQIIRKIVSRKVPKTDSPMSTVLKSLLQGTSLSESKQGLRSFIPANTKLLSATVKDGIAILNLSEEFQFNQYGIEAYQAQLAQIVFTACEFPTVTSVQFLIEGERKNFLGGEGVWIGAPLTPASF